MNKFFWGLAIGFSMLLINTTAVAADKSVEADAVALIAKAQEYIKKNGLEKATEEFNNLESPFNVKSDINKAGDLYIFSMDSKGFQTIHGKNPKIRGKTNLEMKDLNGVALIQELIKACVSKEGKGWVNYHWPNPVSKELEPKRGYAEKVPGVDLCIGTGIYK
jgi:cytochrome c